jgi:hypothetical protein
MKTTLELPDTLFREAKSLAGEKGITFKRLMTEALENRLAQLKRETETEPWRKYFGSVSPDKKDRKVLAQIIHDAFGQIDEDAWR